MKDKLTVYVEKTTSNIVLIHAMRKTWGGNGRGYETQSETTMIMEKRWSDGSTMVELLTLSKGHEAPTIFNKDGNWYAKSGGLTTGFISDILKCKWEPSFLNGDITVIGDVQRNEMLHG
jgi:hypothetical protein